MLHECLQGARVLDLSQYIPGPFASLMLADFGADVVKIEPPGGDPMRTFGPRDADGLSPFYKVLNRGKTVVRLNLKDAGDQAVFAGLVAGADVVLESFRPGVLGRLGFPRERLRRLNPGLVHCALSGFGQSGPYRDRAGHDLTYAAMAGIVAATGTAEEPVIPFPPVADHAGALHAVMAILGVLVRKERSGQGAYLDVSLFESALALGYLGLTLGRRGGLGRGSDLLNGGAAYYRVYRCADGRFAALAPIEPKFWQAFCTAVGRPEWIERQAEPLPQTDLIADVAALFATRPLRAWEDLLHPVNCCFEPVLDAAEVPDVAQVRARGVVQELEGGGGEAAVGVLFPASMDGRPPRPRLPLREREARDVVHAWGVAEPV